MALTNMYATCEPYKKGEYDLRVQKIGEHVRVYKRISISGNWKTNTGSSYVEEVEVTDKYRKFDFFSFLFFSFLFFSFPFLFLFFSFLFFFLSPPPPPRWAEEAGKFFGGLDICTVDAIHTEEGEEYILEVNGTSSGLLPEMSAEDNGYIRDVTLRRMEELLFSSE